MQGEEITEMDEVTKAVNRINKNCDDLRNMADFAIVLLSTLGGFLAGVIIPAVVFIILNIINTQSFLICLIIGFIFGGLMFILARKSIKKDVVQGWR